MKHEIFVMFYRAQYAPIEQVPSEAGRLTGN